MNADIELKLLAGVPLDINESVELKPVSLKKIAKIGYSKYMQYVQCLTFEVEDILKDNPIEGITTYDLVLHQFLIKGNEKVQKDILDAFKLFLRRDVFVYKDIEKQFVVLYFDEANPITPEIYGKMKYYIQLQNCTFKTEDSMGYKIDESNEKARLMDEMGEIRKTMVVDCIHPQDYLIHYGVYIKCRFCENKVSIPKK